MNEKIPQKIEIKPKFEQHYRQLLGDRYDEFIEYSTSYIRKSIRVNLLKKSQAEVLARIKVNWNLEQVPWCKEGFWIEHKDQDRYDIGNLIEHALGYIYVQDAASMIPPVVLEPQPGE